MSTVSSIILHTHISWLLLSLKLRGVACSSWCQFRCYIATSQPLLVITCDVKEGEQKNDERALEGQYGLCKDDPFCYDVTCMHAWLGSGSAAHKNCQYKGVGTFFNNGAGAARQQQIYCINNFTPSILSDPAARTSPKTRLFVLAADSKTTERQNRQNNGSMGLLLSVCGCRRWLLLFFLQQCSKFGKVNNFYLLTA